MNTFPKRHHQAMTLLGCESQSTIAAILEVSVNEARHGEGTLEIAIAAMTERDALVNLSRDQNSGHVSSDVYTIIAG